MIARIQIMIVCLVIGLAAPSADAADSRLPADYWHRPLAPQGQAAREWSDLEKSLAPDSCGACHSDKLDEWSTSLHAKAMSPGLVGQLLTFSSEEARACLICHAPLAEQAAAFETARRHGKADQAQALGLASAGNSCGGCHLRNHRRFGPPQRGTGATGPSSLPAPHGGVLRTADFERSDFCSPCHQFSADQAINGKPLENTVEEWRISPQAAAGQTCQTCHMPDRKHLWRGIHDPVMTAGGLTPKVSPEDGLLRFSIRNSGIGHAFPTYVTPKVILHAVLLDDRKRPVPGSEQTSIIQRRVDYDGSDWQEISDTRLLPGQAAMVEIAWKDSKRARVWLEILPDDFYHSNTYAQLRKELPPKSEAGRLIVEADSRAMKSRYILFETEVDRP